MLSLMIAQLYLQLGIDSPSEVFESNILAKDPEKAKLFPDQLENFCRSCYSKLPCEGDGHPSPGKKGVQRGGKDGKGTKCEEYTEPEKVNRLGIFLFFTISFSGRQSKTVCHLLE